MKDVIVLTGPTASGKTAVSVELAKKTDGEIISADSMQIYKYMDIGTAKPGKEEMQGIRHYMIDIVAPDESYSVARYKSDAEKCIEEVLSRGKVPVVTGGTGLYINSLVYNINYSEAVQNREMREQLQNLAATEGNDRVFDVLKKIDPDAAARLHPNNLKRVIRAIEIFQLTGRSVLEHEAESRIFPCKYNYKVFCLNVERQLLYDRINMRVDRMIENGLIDEVVNLKKMGYTSGATSMQAIGYKEILLYLDGSLSLSEATESIKQGSRRYAKRQMTWMKKIEGIIMLDYEPVSDTQAVIDKIIRSFN